MRLAEAYRNRRDDYPLIKDIARIRLRCGRVELKALPGEEKVILGQEIEVDFATGRILPGERRVVKKESDR